jgi:uncharacterized membrane protein YcfT
MYCASSIGEDTGQTGVLHWAIAFATPFRMPEFFLISGLFLSQVIDRPWRAFADRRVVHYLYFYLLWAVIHIVFKVALLAGDPVTAASYLAWALVEPYGVLWFIYMLAVFGAAAKLLHDLRVPHWVALAIGAGLQMATIHTGSYAVDQAAEYFVFFYAGYAFAPQLFRLANWAANHAGPALGGLALWAVVNAALVFSPGFRLDPVHIQMGFAALPGIHLALALAGSAAICVTAALLARLPVMNWLRWLGEKSLVIYVAFVLPMGVARTVLLRVGIDEPNVLSLITMAVAIIAPLVLWWLVQKTGFGKFLFERPAWAHLPGTRKPSAGSAVPAE